MSFEEEKKYYLQPWKVTPNAGLTLNTGKFWKKDKQGGNWLLQVEKILIS